MAKIKLTGLTVADVLKLGRRLDPTILKVLLSKSQSGKVVKATSSVELLNRQLKEKPLKPLKADDEYWETSEEYLEELQARVDAGVLGGKGKEDETVD